MDTLLRGATIATCDKRDRVVEGDVLIRDGAIASLGRVGVTPPVRVIDARGCAIIPGFVQAHVHLCQVLMRGMADDLPLLDWLRKRIWPLEAAHDEQSLRASADLGLAEMMLAGTTTILDMGTVHHHEVVIDACAESGIRAITGKTMMDAGDGVPRRLRETTKSSLNEARALAKLVRAKKNDRLGYAYAPRFILSCSEKLMRGVSELAANDRALVHTHAAEHPGEREAVFKIYGASDVAILRKFGLSGPRAVWAHGVQLTDEEAKQLARDGTRIVHCPSANLKLGSGIARIHDLDTFGVKLALGADGAPCNNNLDPWTELRHAALLAKSRSSPTAIPARRALRLATIDGARALGLDDRIGSIAVGKRADLVVVRMDGCHVEPGGDVFSRLVYACTARDVVHVFIDGEWIVQNRVHQRLDVERVVATARQEARRLERAI